MASLTPGSPVSGAATRPSKPLLRRSTLNGTLRKAAEAGLDDEMLPILPSPSKRARVTFNPKVEEQVMIRYQIKGRSLENVREEVKRAIEAHTKGDNSESYDRIKEVFSLRKTEHEDDSGDNSSRPEINTYLLALTSLASLLGKSCSGLVKAVLATEWVGRDESFVKSYVLFLGSLASAQGAYVGSVLGMLVGYFAGVRLSSNRLVGYLNVGREQLTSRVHIALKYLLRLIPCASSTLSPLLGTKFPFADESKKVQTFYIQNLISVIDYAPELRSDILALITDRLVKIDVQMQVDLDDLDDEVAVSIVQALSRDLSRDEEEDGSGSDSDANSVTSDEDLSIDSKRIKEIKNNVEKMDAILDLLFNTYSPYFSDPHSDEAISMFETLLGHFTNIILPTYRSRHTQFLLFHFAQISETLIDQFAGTCVQLAFQAGRPAVLRQSAAAYLASFVARGAHVQAHVVRTVFDLIGTHLDLIRNKNELTCRGPDLKRYSTFYAMTQALLYIFCFRWRDLITSPTGIPEEDDPEFFGQDLTWTPGVKETLSRSIYSKLNPLKICSPAIVAEFAGIANHLKFMYVYPLLETNKRITLSQLSSSYTNGAFRETGNGCNNEGWHQLDAYFPFDPYHLPVSKRWIEGDYVQWKGILVGHQDDEEDEDDDEDDEDDEEDRDDSIDDDVFVDDENTATEEDD